jgi:hypothetical protein
MRALLHRCQCGLIHVSATCGDVLAVILSHAGHGHTPWG